MTNGIWGCISVGLFADPTWVNIVYHNSTHVGWFYSWGRGSADATLLACQLVGILFVIGWVMVTMIPFFTLLHWWGFLRWVFFFGEALILETVFNSSWPLHLFYLSLSHSHFLLKCRPAWGDRWTWHWLHGSGLQKTREQWWRTWWIRGQNAWLSGRIPASKSGKGSS